MPRSFADSDIVAGSANSGTVVLSASPITVSLGGPTTEHNAGIIVMACQTVIAPPEQWDNIAPGGFSAPASPQAGVLIRSDIPAGESSWTFSPVSGGPSWVWLAQEWTNVSFTPIAASPASNTGALAATAVSTGSTGAFDSLYVLGIAYEQISSTGGSTWPTAAWSNGFVETDVVSVGTGSGTSDLQLRVARRYGTPADSGPWETTATFTGSMASKTVSAAGMAIIRAENFVGEA